MNTTTKTFIPPENSENQEPQLDLNLLDAKLTDQPEQQKVNQILDNAINTETEDTLESGLFLHVAEEMLEALFQVDTEVFKTQIAQQAEIRKRLQLLISKLSGKQTSLDDIQQLKLELVKVLFSKEEIQVTELKDFAKKFKLKFNQLIVSLLRDSQISEEQNKAFDTFREKLNKDQLKKQVETNEISLSDYLILTEDFEILDQYQDFDKEIQVTQNLYNAFESTPKFSKIKDTGKFYLFSAHAKNTLPQITERKLQLNSTKFENFSIASLLELKNESLQTLELIFDELNVQDLPKFLATIVNNNSKLNTINIDKKEINTNNVESLVEILSPQDFITYLLNLDKDRIPTDVTISSDKVNFSYTSQEKFEIATHKNYLNIPPLIRHNLNFKEFDASNLDISQLKKIKDRKLVFQDRKITLNCPQIEALEDTVLNLFSSISISNPTDITKEIFDKLCSLKSNNGKSKLQILESILKNSEGNIQTLKNRVGIDSICFLNLMMMKEELIPSIKFFDLRVDLDDNDFEGLLDELKDRKDLEFEKLTLSHDQDNFKIDPKLVYEFANLYPNCTELISQISKNEESTEPDEDTENSEEINWLNMEVNVLTGDLTSLNFQYERGELCGVALDFIYNIPEDKRAELIKSYPYLKLSGDGENAPRLFQMCDYVFDERGKCLTEQVRIIGTNGINYRTITKKDLVHQGFLKEQDLSKKFQIFNANPEFKDFILNADARLNFEVPKSEIILDEFQTDLLLKMIGPQSLTEQHFKNLILKNPYFPVAVNKIKNTNIQILKINSVYNESLENSLFELFENNKQLNQIQFLNQTISRNEVQSSNLQELIDDQKMDNKYEIPVYEKRINIRVTKDNLNNFLNLRFNDLKSLEINITDLGDSLPRLLQHLAKTLPESLSYLDFKSDKDTKPPSFNNSFSSFLEIFQNCPKLHKIANISKEDLFDNLILNFGTHNINQSIIEFIKPSKSLKLSDPEQKINLSLQLIEVIEPFFGYLDTDYPHPDIESILPILGDFNKIKERHLKLYEKDFQALKNLELMHSKLIYQLRSFLRLIEITRQTLVVDQQSYDLLMQISSHEYSNLKPNFYHLFEKEYNLEKQTFNGDSQTFQKLMKLEPKTKFRKLIFTDTFSEDQFTELNLDNAYYNDNFADLQRLAIKFEDNTKKIKLDRFIPEIELIVQSAQHIELNTENLHALGNNKIGRIILKNNIQANLVHTKEIDTLEIPDTQVLNVPDLYFLKDLSQSDLTSLHTLAIKSNKNQPLFLGNGVFTDIDQTYAEDDKGYYPAEAWNDTPKIQEVNSQAHLRAILLKSYPTLSKNVLSILFESIWITYSQSKKQAFQNKYKRLLAGMGLIKEEKVEIQIIKDQPYDLCRDLEYEPIQANYFIGTFEEFVKINNPSQLREVVILDESLINVSLNIDLEGIEINFPNLKSIYNADLGFENSKQICFPLLENIDNNSILRYNDCGRIISGKLQRIKGQLFINDSNYENASLLTDVNRLDISTSDNNNLFTNLNFSNLKNVGLLAIDLYNEESAKTLNLKSLESVGTFFINGNQDLPYSLPSNLKFTKSYIYQDEQIYKSNEKYLNQFPFWEIQEEDPRQQDPQDASEDQLNEFKRYHLDVRKIKSESEKTKIMKPKFKGTFAKFLEESKKFTFKKVIITDRYVNNLDDKLGNLNIVQLKEISFPNLRNIKGKLVLPECEIVNFPQLKQANEIILPGTLNINAPRLELINQLYAPKLEKLKAKKLRQIFKGILTQKAQIKMARKGKILKPYYVDLAEQETPIDLDEQEFTLDDSSQ